MPASKILVLGTGGTIAGTASSAQDHTGYRAAQLGVGELIRSVTDVCPLAVESEQVAQVDSKDMDVFVWRQLLVRCAAALARDDVAALVITHGTDTLEETAFFLQTVLKPEKPVVLTCAMRPASALTPDGPQNLLDAFAVAADPATRGVVAVCAGSVHSAIDVQKIYSYRTDAFDSGDRGPLGYVEEGHVRWVRQAVEWPSVWPVPAVEAVVGQVQWPRVEVVLSHAGADGSVVDALLQDRAGVVPLRGLVAAGTGNGTLHQGLEAALRRAQALGVRVLRTSRCARGHVLGGAEDALPGAGGLSAVKARIALMLALMAPPEPAETALPD